ncbi:MFS transporter [Saccharopolyspora sp. CA-218241]|uniref:MFS transporter n=1 Tax=Saccharopolyspora sp. CA-218241 TaxID=3240027 RepID=UPI003D98CB5F
MTVLPRASPGTITAILSACGVVVSLMQTLVVPIIPVLPRLLDASPTATSWVVTATLLATAVITPISGRLGDMYGKRRVLIASMVALVAGSLVCAMSGSLTPMIIGRFLQGCATGAIPLGISMLRDEMPPERAGTSVSLMGATLGVGGALGLPLAAAVTQFADWQLLFWLSSALGAACLVLVVLLIPESPVRTPGRFDVVGALGLTAGLGCLMLAIIQGSAWGAGVTAALLAAAALILLGWALVELRSPQPLVDLRVSASRPVLFTNLASVLVGFSMYSMSLTFPQLLQAPPSTGYGFGQSMLAAGLALAPAGLVMMALSPVSARISASRGPRTGLMAGLLVIACGYGFGLLLMDEVWQIVLSSLITGAGVGIVYSTMPTLIMASVPRTESGAATGLNALMRSIGTSTSSAVMSVVLARMTTSLGTAQVPTEQAFRLTFVLAIVAALAGIGLAALIPRSPTGAPGDTPATPAADVAR